MLSQGWYEITCIVKLPALEGRRRARHVQVLSYKFIDVLDVSLLIIHIYPSNSQWELWIESIHLHKIINRT